MLEAKSAITLALACCLFPALNPATSQPPSANIHLEISLRHSADHNTTGIEFTFRLRTHETTSVSFANSSLRHFAQSFKSLRVVAQKIYCKQRHMA